MNSDTKKVEPKISFADFYSEEDFAFFQQGNVREFDFDIDPWKDALVKFLTALRNDGRLNPIKFSAERLNPIAESWNKFVAGQKAEDRKSGDSVIALLNPVFDLFLDGFLALHSDSSYIEMISQFDDGKFVRGKYPMGDGHKCNITGDYLVVDIQAPWQPRLMHRLWPPFPASCHYSPVESDVSEPSVVTHSIPTPSGELLVADWFRLEGNLFSKIVDSKIDFDINFAYGRAAQTKHYAEKFGFMSVFVGNTSPAIIEHDGGLVIGNLGKERSEFKAVGKISTDIRWVTIIDRETLVGLIAGASAPDIAERMVDDYIMNNADVTVVNVAPGTLNFTYAFNKKDDLEKFTVIGGKKIDFAGIAHPYVVINPKSLEWELFIKNEVDGIAAASPALAECTI